MQEMQETEVWSLSWKDLLKEEMATYSSILVWELSWTEKCHGLQSLESEGLSMHTLEAHAHKHTQNHSFLITASWGRFPFTNVILQIRWWRHTKTDCLAWGCHIACQWQRCDSNEGCLAPPSCLVRGGSRDSSFAHRTHLPRRLCSLSCLLAPFPNQASSHDWSVVFICSTFTLNHPHRKYTSLFSHNSLWRDF